MDAAQNEGKRKKDVDPGDQDLVLLSEVDRLRHFPFGIPSVSTIHEPWPRFLFQFVPRKKRDRSCRVHFAVLPVRCSEAHTDFAAH